MFTNQYIITHRSTEASRGLPDFVSIDFADLRIHAHSKLKVTVATSESTQLALLGFIVDPLHPADADDIIIERLAAASGSPEELFQHIEYMTGRYVLLFKTATSFIVTGDAFHFRQIYYAFLDGHIVVTSSPTLFLSFFEFELQLSEAKKRLLLLPEYTDHEHHWYGDEAMDGRLMKLLPSHYLDVASREVARVNLSPLEGVDDEDAARERASLILRNTFAALARRYRLIQPLTAGWDSRLLLAASREVSEQTRYYVFDWSGGTADDAAIPGRLSRRLGLDFAVVEPAPASEEFLAVYRREHVMPRIMPKTDSIFHHYGQHYSEDVVNVNGNGGEVARCRYGYTRRRVSLDMVCQCTPYGRKSEYVNEQMKKWYADVAPYAEEHGFCVLDLFLWEQRMGHWGAMFPFEQDIAVEEVTPFDNRGLLRVLLSVDGKRRKAPSYRFYRQLIADMWPEALSEPVGAHGGFVKGMMNGNATIRYWMFRAKRRNAPR